MAVIPLIENASPTAESAAPRDFDFSSDTFSYPNELVWEYHFDPKTGQGRSEKRNPPPTYAHHCFVVARSARQFFWHARFAPDRPPATDAGYEKLIRAVVARSPQKPSSLAGRILIPGFANLRQFSAAHPAILRRACGGSWQSYAQRGNWRMVLPIGRGHQERMAAQLREGVALKRLPVIHVVTFPRLTINHTLLLFGATSTPNGLEFHAYDPNICEAPLLLAYHSASRRFHFPRTHYFAGGAVNVYEIYCGWCL